MNIINSLYSKSVLNMTVNCRTTPKLQSCHCIIQFYYSQGEMSNTEHGPTQPSWLLNQLPIPKHPSPLCLKAWAPQKKRGSVYPKKRLSMKWNQSQIALKMAANGANHSPPQQCHASNMVDPRLCLDRQNATQPPLRIDMKISSFSLQLLGVGLSSLPSITKLPIKQDRRIHLAPWGDTRDVNKHVSSNWK